MEIDDTAPPSVFIYCDDASHPRRVAVTNFVQIDPLDSTHSTAGRWNERYTSTAAQGSRESGTSLGVDDRPIALGSWTPGDVVRSNYTLVCRKCRQRPVEFKEERLFAALNRLCGVGVSEISIRVLGAML